MNYKQLKDFLNTLSEAQLEMPVVFFEGDNETGTQIDYTETSKESFYWMDGECYGDKKMVDEEISKDESLSLEDFLCIPAGTVTLHSKVL